MDRRAFIAALWAWTALPALAADELRSARDIPTDLEAAAARGRLVVVVMKGSWCPVCVGQLQRFAAIEDKLHKLDARVVGLNADRPADNRVLENSLGIPILSDPDKTVLRGLGLWRDDWKHPMPAVVVLDRCGEERGRIVGRRPGLNADDAVLKLLAEIAADPGQCGATDS